MPMSAVHQRYAGRPAQSCRWLSVRKSYHADVIVTALSTQSRTMTTRSLKVCSGIWGNLSALCRYKSMAWLLLPLIGGTVRSADYDAHRGTAVAFYFETI